MPWELAAGAREKRSGPAMQAMSSVLRSMDYPRLVIIVPLGGWIASPRLSAVLTGCEILSHSCLRALTVDGAGDEPEANRCE